MFHDDKNPLEPEYTPLSQTQEERFSGFYETGNIRPPKNHGGWVAAVLLTCIFLGGLAGGACEALDHMDVNGMVGTLAGENTVFVVMKDNACAESFCQEIREML